MLSNSNRPTLLNQSVFGGGFWRPLIFEAAVIDGEVERKVLFRREAFFEVSCSDQFKLSSEEYIVMSESYYIFNRGDNILSAAENN